MSEEVKRYSVFIGFEHGEQQMILAADHDRIVSALTEAGVRMQAERDKWQQEAIRIAVAVCALGKMEFDQLTDDSKLIEVMSIIREAIQERDTLRAEVERLTGCLQKANEQAEHFEREWYLRGDEVERLRKDAERYRFIRDIPHTFQVQECLRFQRNSVMDDIIDAALEASR